MQLLRCDSTASLRPCQSLRQYPHVRKYRIQELQEGRAAMTIKERLVYSAEVELRQEQDLQEVNETAAVQRHTVHWVLVQEQQHLYN